MLAGLASALCLFLCLGELFLRVAPPTEELSYLGDASPQRGPFVEDEQYGVAYRSWEAFRADHEERLAAFLPFGAGADARPLWALFGNSFVQAPGMLGDTARAALPERRIFYLGRGEYLPIRCDQVDLLLEHGMRPERIFFVLMVIDADSLGTQPLRTMRVNAGGALSYQPRLPAGAFGALVESSMLARAAWFRTGLHRANPSFDRDALHHGIESGLLADLLHLFANLAATTRAHGVPVSIVLIPSYQQIAGGAPFGFQDTLDPRLRALGFDILDTRDTFLSQSDTAALFLPDKHFSALGNRLLLAALLRHARELDTSSTVRRTGEQAAP